MRKRRIYILLVLLILAAIALPFRGQIRAAVKVMLGQQKSVGQRMAQYGPQARARLQLYFRRAQVAYPPREIVLLALKQEQVMQVYAAGEDGRLHYIRAYEILGASGDVGPKLREGDGQVPEGIYRIDGLNPNSAYHLSLHINYPNAFDCNMAKRDGRTRLGGDIMIHGGSASIGCLAMGDEAAEDLFILFADTGLRHNRMIISPLDFRTVSHPNLPVEPAWVRELYAQISEEMNTLPPPQL